MCEKRECVYVKRAFTLFDDTSGRMFKISSNCFGVSILSGMAFVDSVSKCLMEGLHQSRAIYHTKWPFTPKVLFSLKVREAGCGLEKICML